MSRFIDIFQNLVVKRLQQIYQLIIEFGPKILFSIIILLIGVVCALLLKKIISKLLKALGFDVLSDKIGFKDFLGKGGITKNPSYIIGLAFYWLIIFSTLVMMLNALELGIASQLVKQAIFYIPQIIVALILITLGIFLGRFIGRFVQVSSQLANIPFSAALGKLADYAIIGIAVMMALEQLNIAKTIISHSFIIIFAVLPFIVSLVFLIGGRDIVSSMLAGRFISKEYKKGDFVELDSISGQIETINFITTVIKNNTEEIIIPNSELVKRVVKKKKIGGEQK